MLTLFVTLVTHTPPRQVKVIALDLRTQRDDYYAFNVAHRELTFAAMLGAFLRYLRLFCFVAFCYLPPPFFLVYALVYILDK